MMLPYSVNANTYTTYKQFNDIEPDRKIKSENFEWNIRHPKSLVRHCIEILSVNWMGLYLFKSF